MAKFEIARTRKSLFGALLDARDEFGRNKVALEDLERQPITFGRLVLGSLVLGRKLAGLTKDRETVGVLLPNVQAIAVTLFGLNAFGRVPAFLNFTAGLKNLKAACEIAGIETIVTSRRFVEQGKLDDIVAALGEGRQILWLEDVRMTLTSFDKLRGLVHSWVARRVHREADVKPDDPAVVLFTSGSEGVPKGVVLSNANLVANAYQVKALAGDVLTPDDVFFDPLPIFHSFGLTAGLLTAVLNGMKSVLYPSPLHYRQIPKLIAGTRATVLLATDTFLQGYARAAGEGDLASVKLVIAGAEHVKPETRKLWAKHGAEIVEGYGATECAPVIACNLPHKNHPGSVGFVLPGIEWRLKPVEGIHEGGRLHVRGPNVMKGYLDPASPDGIKPPADGWHDTGDIVTVQDGIVTIRGRAKRFAKIGGEMVSLAAIEATIQQLWPDSNHVVVALPDPRKGEQIVLVTDKPDADRDALLEHAQSQGFPELWVPKAILVSGIPVLGSGKTDYPATVEMARRLQAML
ncbi:AMP-binding protein [Microvirga guangxiensis]|uniref:Acyl-[acyl-carrier-protein]-phospholipid O-acyltransferase / long-chain-fatty-acid--[acyl-carrier-protein] ligase n=1 Tax=Microvirga guangxiensis TaxID=549386 RepID=A0A1G5LEK1_9HYPH|nr:AMP-binding protein [Microvirga guangxiensis]SCZ11335.1 acyl-[acyl-carrier-protein]-phospholipid O-acyltransferase / long-chain-fatty-acid--[acyl-carrier-protein] ligase [Microvirga guangxiensis]